MSDDPASERTRVRYPGRGHYDRATIDAILDEASLCHLAVVQDDGSPLVLPTLYVRDGDAVYVHGSPASRLMRTGRRAPDVCVTVMLLDSYVMAKSAFKHSINYRSVTVVGPATEVRNPDEKRRVLALLLDHVHPGRSTECRPPNDKELAATVVLRVGIDEASAKIRTGGPADDPADDPADASLPFRTGVVPVTTSRGDLVDS